MNDEILVIRKKFIISSIIHHQSYIKNIRAKRTKYAKSRWMLVRLRLRHSRMDRFTRNAISRERAKSEE